MAKKYRFNVVEDESHKSLFSFKVTKTTFTIGIVGSFLILLCVVLALIVYTPIKQLIPGYPSAQTRKEAIKNATAVDSLENELRMWSIYLSNIQKVVTGQEPLKIDSLINLSLKSYSQDSIKELHSKDDSLLRDEVMQRQKYELSSYTNIKIEQIEGLIFYTPVKGVITEPYNKSINHPYIDITSPENSIVSSVLDGTIVSANWNDESGYTIQIQHSNDLISVYKHNAKLIKKAGDKVGAGTPIALVGDTGRLTTGPHLHFELWHKGEPIDPALYINF